MRVGGVEGELDERALAAVRALAAAVEAVHAPQRPADTVVAPLAGHRGRAPLAAGRLGRDLRARRASLLDSLVMTVVPARVAGVPRIAVATPRPVGRAARGGARARGRRGLRGRRRAGDRRARLRDGDDPSRSPRSSARETASSPRRSCSSRRRVAIDLPAGPERGRRDRRRHGRPGRGRRRPARPGRARPGRRVDPSHDEQPRRRRGGRADERQGADRDGGLARRPPSRARTSLPRNTSSSSSPTRRRSPGMSGTRARSSSARRRSWATTQPARTTFCRPAAWPEAPAAWAWRRSSGRFSSSAPRGTASPPRARTVETFAELEDLPLHAEAVAVRC